MNELIYYSGIVVTAIAVVSIISYLVYGYIYTVKLKGRMDLEYGEDN